jgi:hypothetical protein
MDQEGKERTSVYSLWLGRAPLLVAAALIALVTGFNLHRLLYAESPKHPWDSIEIVEAWRSLEGMPVYELSPQGHATHMYGALYPWVQGKLLGSFGVNNLSGRAVSIVSALLLVTLLAAGMRTGATLWCLAVSWAIILGVNHRSEHYFADSRPDMTALLLGTAALFVVGYGCERRRGLPVVLGTVLLVTGFWFKQIVAVFAIVPLVVLLARRRWPSWQELIHAGLPPAAVAGTIVGLKFASPVIYHYMVEIPGGYAVNWPRAVKFLWELLLDSPLFLVVFGEWLVSERRSSERDPRTRWLLAVLAVALPFSVVARAKVGGWANSLLPALLAMAAFAALRLPRIWARVEQASTPVRARLAYGGFLACVVLMTTFPHLTYENNVLVAALPRDREYWQAVTIARALRGKVVCPEDPTIPLHAKRDACRNLYAERDARPSGGTWPVGIPDSVLAEITAADFVVDVTDYAEQLDEESLEDLGFELDSSVARQLEHYKVWRRVRRWPVAITSRATPDRVRTADSDSHIGAHRW